MPFDLHQPRVCLSLSGCPRRQPAPRGFPSFRSSLPRCAGRRFILSRVRAGFPSPADDYVEGPLDLNELLIRRPETTFFLRVEGGSMEGAGIHSGDLLVVDRGVEPRRGDVVIAAVGGNLTVKRIAQKDGRVVLMPDSPSPEGSGYEPIEVSSSAELTIWGVVQHVIHEVS